ncbi:MAG: rhodanese-like domain-containing protein [Caenispirillum bisanense]|nr:rhodanese-like domain-containing protein [Caenispirillum bisanense]MCA1971831.1 rhodanese-like domain-containing protein [Caenispirillum sp.]
MAITKGYKALIDEAMAEVKTLSPAEAHALLDDPSVQFVDIRDVRELERAGMIPGAFHAPRGMLEFWVDPVSPYHKPVFAEAKTFVFYCAAGWRSALATKTVQDMGLAPVAHVDGGFEAWSKAGLPTVPRPAHSTPSKKIG